MKNMVYASIDGNGLLAKTWVGECDILNSMLNYITPLTCALLALPFNHCFNKL